MQKTTSTPGPQRFQTDFRIGLLLMKRVIHPSSTFPPSFLPTSTILTIVTHHFMGPPFHAIYTSYTPPHRNYRVASQRREEMKSRLSLMIILTRQAGLEIRGKFVCSGGGKWVSDLRVWHKGRGGRREVRGAGGGGR